MEYMESKMQDSLDGSISQYEQMCDEITELRTKLAQLEAALKVKDEFIEPLTHVAGKEVNGNYLSIAAMKALAIQPSQESLDEYVHKDTLINKVNKIKAIPHDLIWWIPSAEVVELIRHSTD